MERSPIPPDRASGEIRKKGTAVVTTLIGRAVWAFTDKTLTHNRVIEVSFKAVDLIELF
jgi:hypothetical protein